MCLLSGGVDAKNGVLHHRHKSFFYFFNAMPYRSVACFKNSAYICGAIEKIADILKVFFAVLI